MNDAPGKPQQQLQLDGLPAKRLHPRQCLDLSEAVAGVPMVCEASAVGETTTVELTSGEIQEAIEDHDDSCQDLIRAMSLEIHRRTAGSSVAPDA